MNRKDSPQSVIESYRRRQQMTPVYMAGMAILLVAAGIVILVLWFRGNGGLAIVAPPEPTSTATEVVAAATATETATVVPPTATITASPTITSSPTATETPTPSGPFEYVVKDGDTCWDLAVKNEVDLDVLLAINNFEPGSCPIVPGKPILIPLKDTQLPTETPIPAGMKGKLEYAIKTGETLADIAVRFNSTVDAILKENKAITDVNKIVAGQKIIIPVNIITATPTRAATATNTPEGPTATPTK